MKLGPRPRLQIGIWCLAAFVVTAAVVAWIGANDLRSLTTYDIFPLLGLLAFSLMWTHYIGGALERWFHQPSDIFRTYFRISAIGVLFLILLHPGLFFIQLWLDGFGIPPFSYWSVYLDAASRIGTVLGSISLLIFLAFEAKRRYGKKSWWKYIEYSNIGAMFAIFVHGLLLGGELHGWYRALWIVYGLTLMLAVAYTYSTDRRKQHG